MNTEINITRPTATTLSPPTYNYTIPCRLDVALTATEDALPKHDPVLLFHVLLLLRLVPLLGTHASPALPGTVLFVLFPPLLFLQVSELRRDIAPPAQEARHLRDLEPRRVLQEVCADVRRAQRGEHVERRNPTSQPEGSRPRCTSRFLSAVRAAVSPCPR
jgi:hypothetical protein